MHKANERLSFNPDDYSGDMWCGVYIPERWQKRIIVDLNLLYENINNKFTGTYCKTTIRKMERNILVVRRKHMKIIHCFTGGKPTFCVAQILFF